jgi:hypothetical protein
MPANPRCPDAILAAIPWYPDGLSHDECGAVEAHAADCRACRAELAFLRGDEEPVIEVPDSEAVYARVIERISRPADAEPAATPPPSGGSRLRRFSALARGPVSMAAGLMVALVSGMLTTGVIWTVRVVPTYDTASVSTREISPEGPHLQVVFEDDATVAQMNERLRAAQATVVSGPTPRGVYRVRLVRGVEVVEALETLRGEERGVVAFAEASGD